MDSETIEPKKSITERFEDLARDYIVKTTNLLDRTAKHEDRVNIAIKIRHVAKKFDIDLSHVGIFHGDMTVKNYLEYCKV